MDDIGFIGDGNEIELQKAVCRIYIETDEGFEIMLSLYTDKEKVPHKLYIPQLNRTLHSKDVGFSPDGTKYFRYELRNITYPEYSSGLSYEFIDGGWVVEKDTYPH